MSRPASVGERTLSAVAVLCRGAMPCAYPPNVNTATSYPWLFLFSISPVGTLKCGSVGALASSNDNRAGSSVLWGGYHAYVHAMW